MTIARIHPMYGYGWYDDCMNLIEVPPDFDVLVSLNSDIEATELSGMAKETCHPLSGLQIHLTRRTSGELPTYNLRAFNQDGSKPSITGFCSLTILPLP